MKTNKKNILRSIAAILMIVIAMASCKKCEYVDCSDSCEMIETFNDTTINWQGQILLKEIVDSVDRVLHVGYGLPGEIISNVEDFPKNLAGAGCALRYDVAYIDLFGISSSNPTNGLIIFSGTLSSPTHSAEFVLNTSSSLLSGNALTTIEVPLELASGTNLPANAFGKWVINGIASPTASDISDFNTLIQNIDGVGFDLDWSDGEEEWFFDNFCITNCCNNNNFNIE